MVSIARRCFRLLLLIVFTSTLHGCCCYCKAEKLLPYCKKTPFGQLAAVGTKEEQKMYVWMKQDSSNTNKRNNNSNHQREAQNENSVKKLQQNDNNNNNNNTVDPWISSNWLVCSLAFLSASSDVIAQKRHECYVSMMTGNLIRMAHSLAELRWRETLLAFLVVMSYTGGIALYTIVSQVVTGFVQRRRYESDLSYKAGDYNETDKAAMTVVVAPMILLLMGSGGLLSLGSGKQIQQSSNNSVFGLFLMAVGGGLVNAATMNATGGTVIYACTGHISKIGKALGGQLLMNHRQEQPSLGKDMAAALSLKVVLSFGAGAVVTVAAWNFCSQTAESFPWFATLGVSHAILLGLYGFPAFCHTLRSF